MKPRICFACPHFSTGGMPRYVTYLTRGLVAMGYEVFMVERKDLGYRASRNAILPLLSGYALTEDLAGFCKTNGVQLVHAHDWLWEKPGLPTVFTPHSATAAHLVKAANQDADLFVLVNAEQANGLRGLPTKYIPSFIDTDEFSPTRFAGKRAEILRKYGLPNGPVVVSVGIISELKNQKVLVSGWERVKASLALVGPLGENMRSAWEPLVAAKKPGVFFLGEQSNVAEILSVADLAVFPSKEECASLAALEAAAMGVPLLLSSTSSTETYFRTSGERLAVFLPSDGDFVGKVAEMLGSSEAADMGKRAAGHVREYHSISRGAALHDEAYAAAMAAPVTGSTRFLRNPKVSVKAGFFDGPKIDIVGPPGSTYVARFIDVDNLVQLHAEKGYDHEGDGISLTAPQRYYVNWRIEIQSDKMGSAGCAMNLHGKTVGILFESNALGDTLAWFPYLESFAKKHGCTLAVSTDWSKFLRPIFEGKDWIRLFDPPDAPSVQAVYRLGVYDNTAGRHRADWRAIPLQKVGADVLGVDFEECHLDLRPLAGPRPMAEPYVCLAHASTMTAKEWNAPGGWEAVVKTLIALGYVPVAVSNERPLKLDGVVNPDLSDLRAGALTYMHHAELVVGLPGGLSWLAAALRKRVLMIAGFSMPYTEFTHGVTRVQNFSVCHGCYVDSALPFTRKRDWCPRKNNFICTAAISPASVCSKLGDLLHA